nr:hypothetical protein [Akkermansiaceae bacterium]
MHGQAVFTLLFTLPLLPAFLAGDPLLKSTAALQLTYPTKPGKYYQLQVQQEGNWKDVGNAVKGTGRAVTSFQPAGSYRVITPTRQWVKVWSDEFDGDDLDYRKWAREENNYGGGNFERQAYRTDPKYCYVKDGKLNIAVYRDPHTTPDGKTQAYSSARVRTLHRGDWKFGKFEFRAKVPAGEG